MNVGWRLGVIGQTQLPAPRRPAGMTASFRSDCRPYLRFTIRIHVAKRTLASVTSMATPMLLYFATTN